MLSPDITNNRWTTKNASMSPLIIRKEKIQNVILPISFKLTDKQINQITVTGRCFACELSAAGL